MRTRTFSRAINFDKSSICLESKIFLVGVRMSLRGLQIASLAVGVLYVAAAIMLIMQKKVSPKVACYTGVAMLIALAIVYYYQYQARSSAQQAVAGLMGYQA